MPRPTTAMRKWLSVASADDKRKLAKAAKTSVIYLYHIAAGRRALSADLAQRLAHASGGALDQRELCVACGKCPLLNT
jgi:hypothetical protein